MRVLIQQVLIGEGHLSFRDDEHDRHFLLDIAIPSVKKYAEKFNYDYSLDTEMHELISKLPVLPERGSHANIRATFQKYLNLHKDYDYILLLDSDCFILNNAPELPLLDGITVAGIDHKRAEISVGHLKNRKILSNAGFYLFDNNSARVTYNYMLNRLIEFIQTEDKGFHDEIELARMLDMESDIVVNVVGDNWNFIPISPLRRPGLSGRFVYHFAGDNKYSRYKDMVENGHIDDHGNYIGNLAKYKEKTLRKIETVGDPELVKKSQDRGGILKLRNKL